MGRKHTEETKRRISKAKVGHKVSSETREKISRRLRGHKPSEETRLKLSKALAGKKKSVETRLKMSKAQKGRAVSEKTREKMSKAHKGVLHSESRRKKMAISHEGDKNHNWQGGISFLPYPVDWVDSLKESIRERDGYICQMCGIHQEELGKKLDVHHIDYDKENLDPKNLISLCRGCHMKTNHNRGEWQKYFS